MMTNDKTTFYVTLDLRTERILFLFRFQFLNDCLTFIQSSPHELLGHVQAHFFFSTPTFVYYAALRFDNRFPIADPELQLTMVL
jgi:hypothetical protein